MMNYGNAAGSDQIPRNESDIDSDDASESSDNESEVGDEISSHGFHELNVKHLAPPPARFTFNINPGVNLQFPNDDHDNDQSLLRYFEYFWDKNILDLITVETNRYAAQCAENISQKFSRMNQWKPTNNDEIMIFLAIHILQSIMNKPTIELYWSKNDIIATPIFAKILPFRRFTLIKRCLHFIDNSTYDPQMHPNPKLNKLWSIIEHMNKKFSTALTPERDVIIKDSLMLNKKRLGWMKRVPHKPIRSGIKSFMLCEAKSGYIWSFLMYAGDGTILNNDHKEYEMAIQIVMALIKPILNYGYCLTIEDIYTSPTLADILSLHYTDVYGTMKLNRKDVPGELRKRKLKKGEIVAFQREKICLMKWKNKDGALLSTVHNAEMVDEKQKFGPKQIPRILSDYKITMTGVEKVEQHLTNYAIIKKRARKYYYKFFIHLLDQSLWNSFVLYGKQGGSKNFLQYKLDLVQKIIVKYGKSQPNTTTAQPSEHFRLTGRHFLSHIPPTAKREKPSRQCKVCSSKTDRSGKRIRKETRYYCPDCNVGLCIECFKIYHTKTKY